MGQSGAASVLFCSSTFNDAERQHISRQPKQRERKDAAAAAAKSLSSSDWRSIKRTRPNANRSWHEAKKEGRKEGRSARLAARHKRNTHKERTYGSFHVPDENPWDITPTTAKIRHSCLGAGRKFSARLLQEFGPGITIFMKWPGKLVRCEHANRSGKKLKFKNL